MIEKSISVHAFRYEIFVFKIKHENEFLLRNQDRGGLIYFRRIKNFAKGDQDLLHQNSKINLHQCRKTSSPLKPLNTKHDKICHVWKNNWKMNIFASLTYYKIFTVLYKKRETSA